QYSLHIRENYSAVDIAPKDGNNVTFNTSITPGVWTHLAWVQDASSSASLFVNGNLVGTKPFPDLRPGDCSSDQPFVIGASGGGSEFFPGSIDDVRVWNVARTQAQLQSDYQHELTGSEAGLVGYWKLDEGTGTTATDSSPTHANGTLTGSPTWTSSTPSVAPTLSATSLAFSQQGVHLTSPAQSVTLTAPAYALTSLAMSITGAFGETTTCAAPLSASASCGISVTYTPTAAGGATGQLTISDSAGSQIVGLVGTAVNAGQAGYGIGLDGSSQYGQVNGFTLGATTLTLEAWAVQGGLTGSLQTAVGQGQSSETTGFALGTDASGLPELILNDDSINCKVAGTQALVAGQATFLAGTFDSASGVLNLYLNGQPAATATCTFHTLVTSGQPLYVGRELSTPTRYWKGLLDDVAVWNVVRTQAQVQA
ncbi:MAG: LamG-like jellyroll fold domain-containing protein, partial [Chloroflexota bacterium]